MFNKTDRWIRYRIIEDNLKARKSPCFWKPTNLVHKIKWMQKDVHKHQSLLVLGKGCLAFLAFATLDSYAFQLKVWFLPWLMVWLSLTLRAFFNTAPLSQITRSMVRSIILLILIKTKPTTRGLSGNIEVLENSVDTPRCL